MKTVSNFIENYVSSNAFLEEGLQKGWINYSSTAKYLRPLAEKELKKKVSESAVMMALRRFPIEKFNPKKNKISLGNITLQTEISDYTFINSDSLIDSQTKLLKEIGQSPDRIFYTFTRGIMESTMLISSSLKSEVESFFKEEKLIQQKNNLSSITIQLPKDNVEISGLYYELFKKISWEGIPIYEVVSTTNEFSVIVLNERVNEVLNALAEYKITTLNL